HALMAAAKDQTTLSFLLDVHHKEYEMEHGPWDARRVRKLATLLKLTPYELASMLRINHYQMRKYLKGEKIPGPVRLLLDLFELWVMKEFLGQKMDRMIIPTDYL